MCEKALKEACVLLSKKIDCYECPANCFCDGIEISLEAPEDLRCSMVLIQYFTEAQNERV